jgi:hypothetical protein
VHPDDGEDPWSPGGARACVDDVPAREQFRLRRRLQCLRIERAGLVVRWILEFLASRWHGDTAHDGSKHYSWWR